MDRKSNPDDEKEREEITNATVKQTFHYNLNAKSFVPKKRPPKEKIIPPRTASTTPNIYDVNDYKERLNLILSLENNTSVRLPDSEIAKFDSETIDTSKPVNKTLFTTTLDTNQQKESGILSTLNKLSEKKKHQ